MLFSLVSFLRVLSCFSPVVFLTCSSGFLSCSCNFPWLFNKKFLSLPKKFKINNSFFSNAQKCRVRPILWGPNSRLLIDLSIEPKAMSSKIGAPKENLKLNSNTVRLMKPVDSHKLSVDNFHRRHSLSIFPLDIPKAREILERKGLRENSFLKIFKSF